MPYACGWAGIGDGGRITIMSQQPEQTSLPLAPNPAPAPGATSGILPAVQPAAKGSGHAPQRIPRWLERAELFLRVLLRMYIGLAICYAPWSSMFWDQNPLFCTFPRWGSMRPTARCAASCRGWGY